jgi:catechol 2,3-dioxygenase-like lactoylglutathione lyase family enzyme
MNRLAPCIALCFVGLPLAVEERPARPPITGIARVHVYSTDLHKSREFYTRILGLAPGTAGCTGMAHPCYAINERQQIELVQVTSAAPENLLAQVAFATPDIAGMHRYLVAHRVAAGDIKKDADGVQHFELLDPEGHPIAFVQLPAPRFFTAPAEQVSTRMVHAGFIVKDHVALDRFYMELLGFRMYWHGGFKDADNDWWEIQVPDGSDWIEYMLNISPTADKQERGVQNHFSFAVDKIQSAAARLRTHGLKTADKPEIGRDGKWSYDIYDPDLTRVELMEFQPAQPPCCNPYTGPQPKP